MVLRHAAARYFWAVAKLKLIELSGLEDVRQRVANDAEIEDDDIEHEQTGIGILGEGEADEKRDVVYLVDEGLTDGIAYRRVFVYQQHQIVEEKEEQVQSQDSS